MEPPMADLQYLVFVGPGVFLIGWAIAAYRRHRSGRASPRAAARLGHSATIAYRGKAA
jgi:hypothetical protein